MMQMDNMARQIMSKLKSQHYYIEYLIIDFR